MALKWKRTIYYNGEIQYESEGFEIQQLDKRKYLLIWETKVVNGADVHYRHHTSLQAAKDAAERNHNEI